MSILANEGVKSIFTIPSSQWAAINNRVSSVLGAERISGIISQDLPGYPALLEAGKLWNSDTFPGLISLSKTISVYCETAINNFLILNAAVSKISGPTVPDELKKLVEDSLRDLQKNTSPILASTEVTAANLRSFLYKNQVVDAEIALNKEKLGDFWAPLGEIIDALETAAGNVTGSWSAISNDLANTVSKEINVTIPFIEALDIETAIICWNNVKTESTAFASKVAPQKNIWNLYRNS